MESLEEYAKIINKEITNNLPQGKPTEVYEPIKYIMKLGGKRIRPIAVFIASDLYDGKRQDASMPALAIENFHNFTLLHDDIMDKSPIRRGKPTVHKKWNENIAILSGDLMLIKSYYFLMQAPEYCRTQLINTFNTTAAEVCEGQQLDMNFETSENVSTSDYLNMIRLKTAVLLGHSFYTGGLISNAPEEELKELYDFGVNCGICFQLIDDLLDTFGDSKKFGKSIGNDIVTNKRTFLLLKTLEKSTEKQRKELNYWLSLKKFNHDTKISAVTKIYSQLDIEHETRSYIDNIHKNCIKSIDRLSISIDKKDYLNTFTNKLLSRTS